MNPTNLSYGHFQYSRIIYHYCQIYKFTNLPLCILSNVLCILSVLYVEYTENMKNTIHIIYTVHVLYSSSTVHILAALRVFVLSLHVQ